ncbi:unnamed protein product [Oppiella nova]|uniref:C2H2-type domain-containing protein n=1 Tax=Oppiella nova TaxID=334625 RepID=A0A7R9LA38_9ACAR|nr:unnamed protein product [Oppiella nova]CAG2161468.1 unnamed protein product [Oppiella nova]
MSENWEQMYGKDISREVFVCKHNECKYESIDENEVQIHCRHHSHPDTPQDIKTESGSTGSEDQMVDNSSVVVKKTGKYVCEVIGCHKQFSYLKCFESHKRNEHSTQGTKNMTPNKDQNLKNNDNMWELYVECRPIDGTDRLFCKWPDCHFGSNLRVVLKQHVINSHLTQKRIRSRPKIHNEYEYWDKILFDRKGVRFSDEPKAPVPTKVVNTSLSSKTVAKPAVLTKSSSVTCVPKLPKLKAVSPLKSPLKPLFTIKPLPNSKSVSIVKPISPPKPLTIPKLKLQIKPKPKIESKVLETNHINIDKNKRDVLLSCKGLASMTRVAQYFHKRIINGEKIYWCQWNGCSFKTKKSQKIAEHINLSHIGVDFKCNKPNCNKVFKNPHSYREHQKNHICGFGSFGYGSKGVIGVCRNENLFKYRERVIIKGKKYYRCKCCYAITKYFTGMKRHIHSQHICPFRMNLHLTRHQTPMAIKQEIMELDIHICPFRMNLHLTRHQTPMAIKQEIMELDIDFDLFNNQRFICCLKCNEFFESKEELRKHEIMLCRFRNEVINENLTNEMPNELSFANVCQTNEDFKPMPQKNRLKLSEQIRQNVNAINESIAKNLSLNNQMVRYNDQNQESLEDYIYLKEFENTVYYKCKYDEDCRFSTKLKDKINEHILDKHLQNGFSNGGQYPNDCFDNSEQSSIFEPKIKVEPIDYDDNEGMLSMDIKPSTSGLQSGQNNSSIEKYIEIKCIDGDPNYFCVYNTLKCKYYTKEYSDIKSHIKESHVLYECDVENCGKEFKNPMALTAHKANHICGFGIKGRKSSGVCSLDNIKKYCDEKVINNRLVFACKWLNCRFVSKTRNNVLSHSHHKHICPNRMLANGNQNKPTPVVNNSKPKTLIIRTASPSVRLSIDDSVYDSSSSQGSGRQEGLEVLGTFGTQESLDNFVKYSEEVMIENKTVFVCLYPKCSVTPRNRSYSPLITDKYNSYVTDFKHNMIRHIRRHCNDKPFVCGVNGCEKRFSCSSQYKNHQSSHSNVFRGQ